MRSSRRRGITKHFKQYRLKKAENPEDWYKNLDRRLTTKYTCMVCIPEGYAISDYLDMDDSVVGENEKPQHMKGVKVVFE